MNLSKYRRWRVLLHTVITKQQAKRKQTHLVCFHAVEKYKKVQNVNIQNDYLFFVFVNVFKFQENKFKTIQKNF